MTDQELRQQVADVLTKLAGKEMALAEAKGHIKRILPIDHIDLDPVQSGPELEMIIKKEMGW